MKAGKFILGWAFISFLLLGSVVLTDLVATFIKQSSDSVQSVSEFYSVNDMLFGILSETLRALLLCYLYPQLKTAGTSYFKAIQFGLVISALISTMWLVIGYGSFTLKNPGAFVVYDGIILTLQGILSGAGLQLLYKKNYIN